MSLNAWLQYLTCHFALELVRTRTLVFMFGVLIAAVIAFLVAACVFVLATVVGAAFFPGEGSYGFGLLFAPLGAVIFGVLAFIVALRKLNFSKD